MYYDWWIKVSEDTHFGYEASILHFFVIYVVAAPDFFCPFFLIISRNMVYTNITILWLFSPFFFPF